MNGVGKTLAHGFTVSRAALVGAAIWLLTVGAIVLLSANELRIGLLAGTVTGGVAGALGLVLLQFSNGKGMPAAVAAMAGGMFARMVLVAVGFLVTRGLLGGEDLGFVVAFFAFFAVFVVLEWLVVNAARSTESVLE